MKKLRIKVSCGRQKLGVYNCPLSFGRVDASNPGQREFDVFNFCMITNLFFKGSWFLYELC